jgi:hypothetical protein
MEKPRPDNGCIAWNRAINEDSFIYVGWDNLRDYRALAEGAYQSIKAVRALDLDFGGVDIMVKGEEACVIEVNTAPTLNSSEYVSSRWAKYFDWLFRRDTRRDHFVAKSCKTGQIKDRYSDPRNYIFYNKQLDD